MDDSNTDHAELGPSGNVMDSLLPLFGHLYQELFLVRRFVTEADHAWARKELDVVFATIFRLRNHPFLISRNGLQVIQD